MCLVGASIHGGEKNMELLLSLNILDLASFYKNNSPQSMCVEGDYTPARAYILETLLRLSAGVIFVFPLQTAEAVNHSKPRGSARAP